MSLIPQLINSTEIIAWGIDKVTSEVIVVFIIGCGFFIKYPPQIVINKLTDIRDQKRIYNWLYSETEKYNGCKIGDVSDIQTVPNWCRIEDIASSNGLTIDRARKLCYADRKIALMTVTDFDKRSTTKELEEKWAIKKFIR